MRLLLAIVALTFASSTVWAGAGCPPGTKQNCVQTKTGVQCYSR